MTALRWARILRRLGHRVAVRHAPGRSRPDLVIALHARKSGAAALRVQSRHGTTPLIVALTGTDVYRDIHRSRVARRVLDAATRIVVLQSLAVRELRRGLRAKARVIHQSASAVHVPRRRTWTFDVCVIGHLRAEKDPFRAALAMRHLPADSAIRLLHVGRAMTPAMARRARAEMRRNARYRWLGERPGGATRALLARSRAMVLSSRLEGGANVVSEAVVSGVPVVASRIPGSVGLLGPDYPGYFPVGATRALAAVLRRMECAPAFYARLARACRRRAHLFAPAAERQAWASLLREVAPGPRAARLSGSSPGGCSAGDPRGR